MNSEHLAKEAARLKSDGIFNRALDEILEGALVELARANVDDKTNLLRLQQKAAVVEEIRTVLDRYIIAADVQEDAGSFA